MATQDEIAQAETQLKLGFDALDRGNITQANRAYTDAEKLAGADLEGVRDAQALHAAAVIGAQLGKAPAEHFLERALDAYKKEPATPRKANATAMYGFMLATEGRHAFAIPVMEDALSQYEALGDHVQEANAHFNLGISYAAQRDPVTAAQQFKRALAVARSLPGAREGAYAPIYQNLGAALLDADDAAGAAEALQRAAAIYQRSGAHPQNVADCYFGIGRALAARERWEDAAAAYGQAVSVLETAHITTAQSQEARGTYRHQQAVALARGGQVADAVAPMKAAVAAYRTAGEDVPAAHTTGLVGDLYAQLGETKKAAHYFSDAVRALRQFLTSVGEADPTDENGQASAEGQASAGKRATAKKQSVAGAAFGATASDTSTPQERAVVALTTRAQEDLAEFTAKLKAVAGA